MTLQMVVGRCFLLTYGAHQFKVTPPLRPLIFFDYIRDRKVERVHSAFLVGPPVGLEIMGLPTILGAVY